MNLLHLVLDLFVTPIFWDQITLMALLFCVGLLLNLTAYQWMRSLHNRGENPTFNS